MQVQCPNCSKQLNVPDSAAGKKAKCPACAAVFDVPAPINVAAAPAAVPGPSPARKSRRDDEDEFEEERPRRSRRDEEADDRPRRSRSRDDEDDDRPRRSRRDEDEDDRPRRRSDDDDYDDIGRGGSNWITRACNTLALFLLMGAIASVVFFILLSISNYLYWRAAPGIVFGPFQFRGQTPGGSLATTLILGLLLTVPCAIFMIIGATKLKTMSSWGLGLTAAIIAASLGGILVIFVIMELVDLAERMVTFMQPISLLAGVGATGLLLFAGIRGMIILLNKDAKRAFPSGVSRGRRRRGRDDYDDDY
jgi:hypothetical protein